MFLNVAENTSTCTHSPKTLLFPDTQRTHHCQVPKFFHLPKNPLGFDENTPRNTDTMVNCRNWGGGAQSSFRMLLLRLIFFSTLTYLVVKFKWLILILITGYIHLCKNKWGGYDPTPFFDAYSQCIRMFAYLLS